MSSLDTRPLSLPPSPSPSTPQSNTQARGSNAEGALEPHDLIGPHGQYRLLRLRSELSDQWSQTWDADSPEGACRVRVITPHGLSELSKERRDREVRGFLRESARWRAHLVARPRLRDCFWRAGELCWVESPVVGAPLSSLQSELSLYEGMSLIEECLCALDLLHAERDIQVGDPLLHLNINPNTIWRGERGRLYLMRPLLPSLIELYGQRKLSDEEALSGEVAPELLRGRYGRSSDLYAVGMSALSAMTGMSVARVDERLQSEKLFKLDLTAPEAVIEFLERLTAFRASMRFQSAREALSALTQLPPLEPLEPSHRVSFQEGARLTPSTKGEEGDTSGDVEELSDEESAPRHQRSDAQDSAQDNAQGHAQDHAQDNAHIDAQDDTEEAQEQLTLPAFYVGERDLGVSAQARLRGELLEDEVIEPIIKPERNLKQWIGALALGLTALVYIGVESTGSGARGGSGESDELTSQITQGDQARRARLDESLVPPRDRESSITRERLGRGSLGSDRGHQGYALRAQGAQERDQRLDALGAVPSRRTGVDSRLGSTDHLHPQTSLTGRSNRPRGGVSMTPTLSPEASYLGGTVRGYIRPQWISLPAGTATIGSRADEGYESERPQHRVQLKAFEISRSEVTVLQYAQCVTAGYCSDVGLNHTDWGESRLCNWGHIERADHPLNCVSWHQAQRYAEWVGGRLPSEAEWSYAAQGGSSQPIRYPWGDDEPSCDRVVIADEVKGAGCGLERTAPVCSRPLGHSKLSACDMVGNVWEWVEDEWHADYRGAPRDGAPWYNPLSDERVYRGGGAFNDRDFPRIARRHKRLPEARLFNLGFRVARGLNPRGSGALDGSVRDTESAKAGDPETRDPETRDPETRDPETGSPETRDPEARPAQGRRRPGRYDRLFERPGLIGE